MTETATSRSLELEVLSRAIDEREGAWSTEIAQAILSLKLSKQDVDRASALAGRRQAQGLTGEEEMELDSYRVAARLIELLKAEARRVVVGGQGRVDNFQ